MSNVSDFCRFLSENPTPWHTCRSIIDRVATQGGVVLDEKNSWALEKGAMYVVQRGGSIVLFRMPLEEIRQSTALLAHTDSPSLRLKPRGVISDHGYTLLHFEPYGSPILASWIGQDLFLAGRVFFSNAQGVIEERLVALEEVPFMIPDIAPHIQRKEEAFDKEKWLRALVTESSLEYTLDRFLPEGARLLSHELFAVPLDAPRVMGLHQDWIASRRLDNMASVYGCFNGFLEAKQAETNLSMAVFWNHEEIGSKTQEGASSSFFLDIFERIIGSRERFFQIKANSSAFSFDVAHALHPNHLEKQDLHHTPRLGHGVTLKSSAQEKYIGDPLLMGVIKEFCSHENIPLQVYSGHNMIPTGSTVGPIHAALTGIRTIDLGIPLLGMHAARELIALKDLFDSVKIAKKLCSRT